MTPAELKTTRLRLGLSQRGLAEVLGVSWRTFQGWEQGRLIPAWVPRALNNLTPEINPMITIPDEVLQKIQAHRPHLVAIITNLRQATTAALIRGLEKRLADAYLAGETRLSAGEVYKLAACSAGRPYGT